MEVRYVNKQDLRTWWTWIRRGLDRVLKKTQESWIPEDLYCDCYEGRSMLWVALEYGRPIGFFVIQPNQTNVHVWVAYLKRLS